MLTNMLTVSKHAEKEEAPTSFTEELLLLQIHTEAGTDFPGPSVRLLDGENLWALKQKELPSWCQPGPESHFCVIPGNIDSEFR